MNYKKQVFYQNYSLALHTDEIFDNLFNFKKLLDLDLQNLELHYYSRFNFMIYWTIVN